MSFTNSIITPLFNSINKCGVNNAFCIKGAYYSYNDLKERVVAIRESLPVWGKNKAYGLVPNDDINTYAAIFALWSEGKHYVPLHPSWPIERCKDIISQVEIEYILDSSDESRFDGNIINTAELTTNDVVLKDTVECHDDEIAYILFTSGSTGKPKGVPIKRKNLSAFVKAFWNMGLEIMEEDRCLQCFELTFDLSVFSYLIPLLKGACVYTVPSNVIKYGYISGLLEDYELTVALMAPSTINYLRPYFDEIEGKSLRLSLFCGEALHEDVTKEWAKCVPNARIFNVYGPTEDTIFCTYYEYQRNKPNKSHNGVLSIGKTMTSGEVRILDENGQEVKTGELGELMLLGNQLFDGYWKNEEKTKEVFQIASDGSRYYKSGDLCYFDEEGDIMYSGRKDFQAKIQGFRVELGEIEFHAKEILDDTGVVCVAFENEKKLTEIAMFIESSEFDTTDLLAKMREKMPAYMIPSKIIFLPVFPHNMSDKVDKVKLKSMIN